MFPKYAKTVMVVTPDVRTRANVHNALAIEGFRVFQAGDFLGALAQASTMGSRLDLLVTDVLDQDIDGIRLTQRLISRHPALKVLFMSAYCEDLFFIDDGMAERSVFIAKPFDRAALLRKIRQLAGARIAVAPQQNYRSALRHARPAPPRTHLTAAAARIARVRRESRRAARQLRYQLETMHLLWAQAEALGRELDTIQRTPPGRRIDALRPLR